MKKIFIFYLFLLLILTLIEYKDRLFTPTDIKQAEYQYSQSQYVLGDSREIVMGDGTLYTYAGYRYIQGEDPTKINFEHPPLGKYIIGASYFLFGNNTYLIFILFLGSFYLYFLIIDKFIDNKVIQILALTLFVLLKIFIDYATSPMLDIPLLFSTLLFFYSLLIVKGSQKQIFLGIALGLYSSIKYPIPAAFILIFILFIYYLRHQKLKKIIPIFLIASSVYLLSYSVYFINDPNPFNFLKFEWYRFRWWTGDRNAPKFLIISDLFLGKYKSWITGEYIYDSKWTIFWPILFLIYLFSHVFYPIKKFDLNLISIFAILQFLAYGIGSASDGRYLLQLFPFWIIVFTTNISSYFKLKKI